jgi:hypothetical protein
MVGMMATVMIVPNTPNASQTELVPIMARRAQFLARIEPIPTAAKKATNTR